VARVSITHPLPVTDIIHSILLSDLVQLRRWADLVLVAPCSANTLAKIAGGICDNLGVRSFSVWRTQSVTTG
jgi:phosphopantothenoylcysteine synthetase/decarboxylase